MSIFDKLTGGGVDWQIQLDNASALFRPGSAVPGHVRFTPERQIDPRATKIALIGSEHYVYSVPGSSGSRGSSRNSRWFADERFRQELDLTGTESLAGGAPREFPFSFQIPADALPSFESNVLRLRWVVRAWMDTGGKDPSAEREIYVRLEPERFQAPAEALAPVSESGPLRIAVEPAPIVAGQPFRGYVLSQEPLDVSRSRIEVKQKVRTHGGGRGASVSVGGVNVRLGGGRQPVEDQQVLWSGQLTATSGTETGRRYGFSGNVPPEAFGPVELPHGSATPILDLVVSRRFLPDQHHTRPVAIVPEG